MDKIKMIKKDALINITIGAGMLQKLQKIMFGIAAELSPEQLEEYKKEMENFKQGDEFSEPWMESLTTISILITECEKEAEKQGFTFEGNIDDVTTES
jgi:hypothetical protein